jgi:Protein of unknown function (DUF1549)/Protein of unknown function (DUF1553)
MWKKNLLFIAAMVVGVGSLFGGLMQRERVHTPRDFNPNRFANTKSNQLATNPDDWAKTLTQLNHAFVQQWQTQQLSPAPHANDLALARRLSLALMGTVPSVEELRALEKVEPSKRQEWWLSYILADPRFGDYVAERLARAYVGTEDGPFIVFRRNRFVTWLSEQVRKNVPYDQIVRHILQDEGIWTDTPSVNFISVSYDGDGAKVTDPVKLASRTTRAFLAQRIDCLQCHDDNLDTINLGTAEQPVAGEQRHFHELAAFFGQANVTRRGISDSPMLQYKTKYLHETEEHVVPAHVPFGEEYFSSQGSRRQQLAAWVTHRKNKPFARAMVNRVWALLFGRPLYPVIDNIPLQGELPPGMELLANDFIEHNYNIHRLIRLIAASEPFQLDSAADFELTPAHEEAWAVFPLTSLRPEQMAGALIQAAKIGTIDGDAHVLWKLIRFGQTNDFLKRYGDAGQDEFAERGGTIPQRLMMMNGNLVKERTDQNIVLNASTRLALLSASDAQAIETAFLAVLTRRPSAAELEHFSTRFAEQKRNRMQKMEDLYWTLFNTTEFSWNH